MRIGLILIFLSFLSGCHQRKDKPVAKEEPVSVHSVDSSVVKSGGVEREKPSTDSFDLNSIDSLKNKKIHINSIDSTSYPEGNIVYFDFSDDSGNSIRDYGRGLAVIVHDSITLWNLDYGDYPSHSYNWLDFDGDGDKDLYTLAGEEMYFNSRLFLNMGDSLKEIFSNDFSYCPLIDIDNDGIPEILNTRNEGVVEVDYEEVGITSIENRKISNEYDLIVGSFDEYNYKYNMPKWYKLFSLNILSSVNILKVKNGKMIDVSKGYESHFCFRLNLLQSLDSTSERVEKVKKELISEYSSSCSAD